MIKSITQFYIKLAYQLDKADAEFLPLVARLIFGFTLLGFFWRAGLTKLGEGASKFFMPSSGAYAQILPQKFEAVGYDQSGMSILDWLVVMAELMVSLYYHCLSLLALQRGRPLWE